jgi:D-glycero-alpha-D-manno-heptose-7-phosphate kinase
MIIRARAPLRLGLAGGGTDVSPYTDEYGGCVLNATIYRYAYATIRTLDESIVRFVASDLMIEKERSISDTLERDGKLDLHTTVYNYMMNHYNGGRRIPLELSTFCDAPAAPVLVPPRHSSLP